MAKKKGKSKAKSKPLSAGPVAERPKMSGKRYESELAGLHAELVKLQRWLQHSGHRVIVVFEGRDAAGKGGVIKRITERVSPRIFRVAALPAPSEREKTQVYLQRYMAHFPAAGEVVLFDRSWYNRAGVERVMGFCSQDEYERFLRFTPEFERAMVDSGVQIIKYWFEVGMEEQERRFRGRMEDPRKTWKLSPMDVESYQRWYQYSQARDAMLEATDRDFAPWNLVRADNKKRARLNCITHLLSQIPYEDVPLEPVKLGKRNTKAAYDDASPIQHRRFIPEPF